jgi:hypothetical protein
MSYPQLRQKIDVLNRKYGIDPAAIAQKIKKDKATAWRWLFQRPDSLNYDKQQLLVGAICETINQPNITEPVFRGNNILTFCLRAGLSKFEAAIYNGFSLPVPELIIDSLFDLTGDVRKYEGVYLLFRHDKQTSGQDNRYIQTCVRIYANERDILMYEDFAVGSTERITYEGYIYLVGSVLNIVGQSKLRGRAARPELWWCGLKVGSAEANDQARILYGYVSDLTSDGNLYVDRLAMVRVTEKKWQEVKNQHEFRIPAAEVQEWIGAKFMEYLERWQNLPIGEPH